MKGRIVVLDSFRGHEAAALIVDGVMQDLIIAGGRKAPPGPGTMFWAVTDRILNEQGSAILRLPEGRAFLRQSKNLRPGQSLLVQVTGHAEPGKATPVTQKPVFKSRFAIVTPGVPGINIARSVKDREMRCALLLLARDIMKDASDGLILRSAVAHGAMDAIAEDIAATLASCERIKGNSAGDRPKLLAKAPGPHLLAWRDWSLPKPDTVVEDARGFEHFGILAEIDRLESPRIDLPDDAFAFIEPTRALIAVDVNTGGDTSPAAALKANIALARALPRALRLRGLGGQITVDFVPVSRRDRQRLERLLKVSFQHDSVDTALVGWTPSGHFELQRKRERLPLFQVLRE
ncbi:MAG: ribonuclease E/G [Pseudomonadota bacterium]